MPLRPAALAVVALTAIAPFSVAAQEPVSRTEGEGRVLEFDFPGLRIGVAEYDEGPTGTTLFYFPEGGRRRETSGAGRPAR